MPSFTEVFILVFVLGGAGYWYDAMRAKERAREAGRRRCDAAGVSFLDDTVSLTRLRLRRGEEGGTQLYREFRFEFASDGSARYGGQVALLGARVLSVEMEPYREAVPVPPAVETARERAARTWLH